MKTTHPTPTTFNPELSHTLQVLKFVTEQTNLMLDKAFVLKEADVNAVHPSTTEVPQKKNPFHVYPDFPFSVQRDFSDDLIEVAIEVKYYRPAGSNRGLDSRDPNFDGGEVTFGDAHYLDGRECVLSELEREAAEESFWK